MRLPSFRASSTANSAIRVLPDPVGAVTRTSSPSCRWLHASTWKSSSSNSVLSMKRPSGGAANSAPARNSAAASAALSVWLEVVWFERCVESVILLFVGVGVRVDPQALRLQALLASAIVEHTDRPSHAEQRHHGDDQEEHGHGIGCRGGDRGEQEHEHDDDPP